MILSLDNFIKRCQTADFINKQGNPVALSLCH